MPATRRRVLYGRIAVVSTATAAGGAKSTASLPETSDHDRERPTVPNERPNVPLRIRQVGRAVSNIRFRRQRIDDAQVGLRSSALYGQLCCVQVNRQRSGKATRDRRKLTHNIPSAMSHCGQPSHYLWLSL
jgi:hypothetical protein